MLLKSQPHFLINFFIIKKRLYRVVQVFVKVEIAYIIGEFYESLEESQESLEESQESLEESQESLERSQES